MQKYYCQKWTRVCHLSTDATTASFFPTLFLMLHSNLFHPPWLYFLGKWRNLYLRTRPLKFHHLFLQSSNTNLKYLSFSSTHFWLSMIKLGLTVRGSLPLLNKHSERCYELIVEVFQSMLCLVLFQSKNFHVFSIFMIKIPSAFLFSEKFTLQSKIISQIGHHVQKIRATDKEGRSNLANKL